MGKSSSSCLKIIVCGSDSAENDDEIHTSEAKTPNDKRGWSFRKRSGRHRVLGNNVSSETTTSTGKETPLGGDTEFQAPVKSICVDEKPQLPKPVDDISKPVDKISKPVDEISKPVDEIRKPVNVTENRSEPKTSVLVVTSENGARAESKVSLDEVGLERINSKTSADCKTVEPVVSEADSNETSDDSSIANESFISNDESVPTTQQTKDSMSGLASVDGCDAGDIMDETIAVIIQTAMRGFLARRKFSQLKSVVKVQAVVRGHLVRRHAIATLHCIRAIVKVQALVRARNSKCLDRKNIPNDAQFSTVKLFQNSFTRQLLESMPRPKSLNIRCDPMKPDSAWSWLERWMAVSTSEAVKNSEPCVEPETKDEVQVIALKEDAGFSSVVLSESKNSMLSTMGGAKLMENDEHHITDEILTPDVGSSTHLQEQEIGNGDLAFVKIEEIITDEIRTTDGGLSISFENDVSEQSLLQEQEIGNKDIGYEKTETFVFEASHTQAEPLLPEGKPASLIAETQQPKLSTKCSATSDLNGEGKKFSYGSRKASNPAFIAAQSKFEELTSAANTERANSSSLLDVEVESPEESVKKTDKPGDMEMSGTSDPRIHVAGSECGTELSISSTLDSPDRSDIENAELVPKAQILDDLPCQPDVGVKLDREDIDISGSSMTDIQSVTFQQQEVHGVDNLSVDPVSTEISPGAEHKVESKESDVQTDFAPECSVTKVDSTVAVDPNHQEHGSAVDRPAYKPSPEASPISHRSVPESQGTPSSQVSVKGKRNKADKHGSNRKRNSPSSEKKSLSNPNTDSGARTSTEHLPKDHKSGKRRNSFGSTKTDNAGQEPGDNSSRSSLPSYMQATESARAKASSPRSSPDVHDKEIYSKKRHSLPGATGRHGSPHVQQSTSQSTQGAKGNGSNPSNERKWLR
ncbi:protein IQ-DOMAIN 32-like [Amaranthus tricolor]|uniref:protein IQ-DOMAIN 32-like n=1 Tax=Amaranthus tricolor TaxID=29722 RepID=UPI00258DF116|nr:protein IQ-DOMAIN 32-like [Amaranthus tricolor]